MSYVMACTAKSWRKNVKKPEKIFQPIWIMLRSADMEIGHEPAFLTEAADLVSRIACLKVKGMLPGQICLKIRKRLFTSSKS